VLVHLQGPWSPIFGRLTLASIPYSNPIIIFAFAFTAIAGIAVVVPVLYYRKVGYIFREWLCSVDHKKIGVMYIILGLVMMFRGFVDGMMIRTQQVTADGPASPHLLEAQHGYLPPSHFDQIYSSHGTLMILFAATPILTGHRALADRRARHGISTDERDQPVADRDGRDAGDGLALHR
jgi:cytochrome o ubiquinol oxidase subunit 1